MDVELERRWKRVVAAWDDDEVHASFLDHCRVTGALPEAAARYRSQKIDPYRGAGADARLKTVTFLALQSMEEHRATPPTRAPRWLLALAFLITCLSVYALVRALGG
jgi:hypothetical protein